MKKFLLNITFIIIATLAISVTKPFIALYKLHKFYPLPQNGAIKYIKGHTGKKNTLVIGCSNLQHNIDFKMVQDSVNADFMYFSGSQNSTFLNYIFDKGLTEGYENIILYAPYHIIKKSSSIDESQFNYKLYGCFDYVLNNIKHNPSKLFYNWNTYFDSIALYHKADPYVNFIDLNDKYMEMLCSTKNSFSDCNEPFIHKKQIIEIPKYISKDVDFVNGLQKSNTHIYILFTPIPNIKENINQIDSSNVLQKGYKNLLNKPFLMDSSFFYDQWYHLNKCGQKIESEHLIYLLKNKLHAAD